MDIIIRKVKKEDIEDVADIKISGWQTAYKGIIDNSFLEKMDKTKEIEKSMIYYNKDIGFIVALNENEIVGFSRYSEIENQGEIDCEIRALYVKPELKNNGIGRKLFNYAVKEFKQKRKNKMIIWCLKENYPSRAFYEKMGGKFSGVKKESFGDKEYELVSYVYSIK